MRKNRFENASIEDLRSIYIDIKTSHAGEYRTESLTSCGKAIKDNSRGDYSLIGDIDQAKKEFYEEVAKRYFSER